MTSLAAFVLVAASLTWLARIGDDFFKQILREQSVFLAQVQDGFARQRDETALRDLLIMREAGNVNLTRVVENRDLVSSYLPVLAPGREKIVGV